MTAGLPSPSDRLARSVSRIRRLVVALVVGLPTLAVLTTSTRWARGLCIAYVVVVTGLLYVSRPTAAFGRWCTEIDLPNVRAATFAGVRTVNVERLVEVKASAVYGRDARPAMTIHLRDADAGWLALEANPFPDVMAAVADVVRCSGVPCSTRAAERLGLIPRASAAVRFGRLLHYTGLAFAQFAVVLFAVCGLVAVLRGVSLDAILGS